MTISELIELIEGHGIAVSWGKIPTLAAYHHRTRTIWIDPALASMPRAGVSTLAHEYIHALHGHDGAQPASVETRVDREAAQLLVVPEAYARAEQMHDGNAAAIAEELGVTTWIIEAYRETLTNKNGGTSTKVPPENGQLARENNVVVVEIKRGDLNRYIGRIHK
ncbi:hypothetical protein QEV61_04540 [Trueperella pyogenes]|uniref:ImmA/IrrE family metallo-endopeptidase n=1 Tax=Trueperella pyogenes TaxID=1661 RepID=UPI0032503EFA